jgi:hypothetical protein
MILTGDSPNGVPRDGALELATLSWAVKSLRVFLGMEAPPHEVIAHSSRWFVPFQLTLSERIRRDASPERLAAEADAGDDHVVGSKREDAPFQSQRG